MATGALIRCVPNASLEALLPAVAHLPDGDGGSARWMICRPATELRLCRSGSRAPPALVSVSSAASQSSGLAGTESGKAPAPQISAQRGMRAASSPGNCGRTRTTIAPSSPSCRTAVVRYRGPGCSELPRSTIAFLSSALGPTTATCPGPICWHSGVFRTSK